MLTVPPTRSALRRPARALTGAVCLLSLVGVALGSGTAAAADDAAPGRADQPAVSWRADLSKTGADDVNVRWSGGALRVRDDDLSPASVGNGRGYASEVLAVHHVDAAVDRVAAAVRADVPTGARVVVDVRGRAADGTWTEWRQAAAGAPAELPRAVTDVQARLTLWNAKDSENAASPAVRSLKLTADNGGDQAGHRSAAAATAFTARVYATREGLVGGTTANGHVIQSNDHFVALPSRRGLSPNGSSQYSVKVCGPARCETAPVWDVGPWNTHDDYWNTNREQWGDLARGLPEAQAAYQNGYNGGRDEFGRQVANPAGIDLADGTFYNIGLNNNGWVTVTYLWTGGGGSGTSFPTWGTGVNIHRSASTGSAVVGTLSGPTSVRVQCQVHGELVNYDGYSNDAWSYLPDYGGYMSNIFVDVNDSWLPGVPTC
jgi:hypothetical protein